MQLHFPQALQARNPRLLWIALCIFLKANLGLVCAQDQSVANGWRQLKPARFAELQSKLPPQAYRERDGRAVILREGSVLRMRKGALQELPALTPTGEVRDLTPARGGLAFFAAEEGLFVLSDDVDVLDRVPLWDSPESVVGFHSVLQDEHGSLWLAGDTHVGVIDSALFFGSWRSEQELPAAGPYQLSQTPDGQILLETANGVWMHHLDQRSKVDIQAIRLDGQPVTPEHALSPRPGTPLDLKVVTQTEVPPERLRYRWDQHHLWRPLASELPLRSPGPGRHTLEVVAYDDDLSPCEAFIVKFEVPYPIQYEPAFVGSVLALVIGLLFALFVRRYRQRSATGTALARAALSTWLAVVVGGQVLAGLVPHAKGWPFVGFSMYCDTYAENDIVHDPRLVGTGPAGIPRNLSSLGAAVDNRWQVLGPLIEGGQSAADAFMTNFNRQHPKAPLVSLAVQSQRTRLTPSGPVAVAPLVLAYHEASSKKGNAGK